MTLPRPRVPIVRQTRRNHYYKRDGRIRKVAAAHTPWSSLYHGDILVGMLPSAVCRPLVRVSMSDTLWVLRASDGNDRWLVEPAGPMDHMTSAYIITLRFILDGVNIGERETHFHREVGEATKLNESFYTFCECLSSVKQPGNRLLQTWRVMRV